MNDHFMPIQYCFPCDFNGYKESLIKYHQTEVLYYEFCTTSLDNVIVVADTSVDIQFCCDKKGVSSIAWGAVLKPETIPYTSNKLYCGIKLSASDSRRLSILSYPNIVNVGAVLPVSSLLKSLCDSLMAAKTFDQRMGLIQNWLKRLGFFDAYRKDLVDQTIDMILKSKGDLKISEVASHLKVNERYLRGKFNQEIGFSPKMYSRIIRFQNLVKSIISDDTKSEKLIRNNLLSHYYDESHLSKEIKLFTGLTPGLFIKVLCSVYR